MDESTCIWCYDEYNNVLASSTYSEDDVREWFADLGGYVIYFFADTVSHPNAK